MIAVLMRPLFITFEGLDGSGKSTHLSGAAEWLQSHGHECETTHEPGGTLLGDALRRAFLAGEPDALDGTVEALIVFASRRQHLREVIEPTLAAGRHVLCDRFTDSTKAYQGFGRGLEMERIEVLDRIATDCRTPDWTVLFDLDPELARSRSQKGGSRRRPDGGNRLDAETLAFYERVRKGYLELARAEPQRFRVIDSSGSKDETFRQVEALLLELFEVAT
jgi:dTMP kinase